METLVNAEMPSWLIYTMAACGFLAQVAAITPNPKDDSIMKVVMDIVNVMAGNWGFAKNKK